MYLNRAVQLPKNITLSIADFNISLNFFQTERAYMRIKWIGEILTYYKDFIDMKNPKRIDYSINFIVNERADIIFDNKTQRRFINFYESESETKLTTYYQIGIYQFQIIIINILHNLLSKNDGFLLHASANKFNRQAALFLGDHGSGKSTIMKMLNSKYPALADDSAIVRKESNNYYFFQTPLIEKENWFKRESVEYKIKNIFFLRKANFYKIEKVKNKEEILKDLLKVFWIVDKKHSYQLAHIMEFVNNFNNFYNLYFAKDKNQVLKLFADFKENNF